MPETNTEGANNQTLPVVSGGHFHGHHHVNTKENTAASQLLRYRVIAMVSIFKLEWMELNCLMHIYSQLTNQTFKFCLICICIVFKICC